MKRMAKIIPLFIVLVAALATRILMRPTQEPTPPPSSALEQLDQALEDREEIVRLEQEDWDRTDGRWTDALAIIEDHINETPERYWVDFTKTKVYYYVDGKLSPDVYFSDDVIPTSIELRLAYFTELDLKEAQQRIDDAAQRILDQVPAGVSDWEAARIIHDELIRHVTYVQGDYEQTIYGALVEGEAVCNGYAMAYEYLLNEYGIPCDTVVGYTDEFSAGAGGSINFLYRHAWNIVTLTDENGTEQSYYVDTTWDDTDYYDADGHEYISYNWFCLSQAQMDAVGRAGLEDIYDFTRWDMSSDALNYYEVTDSVVEGYDLDDIIDALLRQRDEGNNLLSVRWEDESEYMAAMTELEDEGLSHIVDALDEDMVEYSFTDHLLSDGNFCMNVFINVAED